MAKKLYLIGGTMGVGKTTTCRILKEKTARCVFLDGDWCWDMHPFQVTDETKNMVIENICFLLNNFISCSAYQTVIFCWVMHEQTVIDDILSRLQIKEYEIVPISLICNPASLAGRLQKDVDAGVREADVIPRSMTRIPLYDQLDTIKIDVSDLTPDQAARMIAAL